MDDVIEFFRGLENEISRLPNDTRSALYKPCAIRCVQYTTLPIQKKQFIECDCSLDAQYEKYGSSEYFFAKVIERGHKYEIGYPRCVCPAVLAGFSFNPAHCECSRQSIIYILNELMPDKTFFVETLETELMGGTCCRFSVTVE